jgi:RNA polymerase primary sigma factor
MQLAHDAAPSERVSRARPWSRDEEYRLFGKMHDLKWRAKELEARLDSDGHGLADRNAIVTLRSQALALRNRIVELNLRLVVSIAKKHVRPGYDLADCVGDGNLALIQAADTFDVSKGNRFSTYAFHVIRNTLLEGGRRNTRYPGQPFDRYEEFLAAKDPGLSERERREIDRKRQVVIKRWLGRLAERERRVLVKRFGIEGDSNVSLAQIGRELGMSREGARKVAFRAQVKLREFARCEAVEI